MYVLSALIIPDLFLKWSRCLWCLSCSDINFFSLALYSIDKVWFFFSATRRYRSRVFSRLRFMIVHMGLLVDGHRQSRLSTVCYIEEHFLWLIESQKYPVESNMNRPGWYAKNWITRQQTPLCINNVLFDRWLIYVVIHALFLYSFKTGN